MTTTAQAHPFRGLETWEIFLCQQLALGRDCARAAEYLTSQRGVDPQACTEFLTRITAAHAVSLLAIHNALVIASVAQRCAEAADLPTADSLTRLAALNAAKEALAALSSVRGIVIPSAAKPATTDPSKLTDEQLLSLLKAGANGS